MDSNNSNGHEEQKPKKQPGVSLFGSLFALIQESFKGYLNPFFVFGFIFVAVGVLGFFPLGAGMLQYAMPARIIGLVVGGLFIVVGLIHKQRVVSGHERKDGGAEPAPIFVILIFMLVIVLLAAGIMLWQIDKDPTHMLFYQYYPAFTIILIGTFTAIASHFVQYKIRNIKKAREELEEKIKECTNSLKNTENELKNQVQKSLLTIEDATRRVYTGFHQIFNRAFRLMREAKQENEDGTMGGELIYVNFMLKFGAPHLLNDEIVRNYREDFGRDFEQDVERFYELLWRKAQMIPNTKILTVSRSYVAENFFRLLKNRNEYAKLDVDKQVLDFDRTWEDFKERVTNKNCFFSETPSLPIQLIIAELAAQNGQSRRKYGCLVFMIGTEILRGKPRSISGFYTELDTVVPVYQSLAQALIEQANSNQYMVTYKSEIDLIDKLKKKLNELEGHLA